MKVSRGSVCYAATLFDGINKTRSIDNQAELAIKKDGA